MYTEGKILEAWCHEPCEVRSFSEGEKEDLRGCTKFYKFSNEHLVTNEREPTVIYGIGTS